MAKFTWFGHSAVEIETDAGQRILLDPWLGNPRGVRPASSVDRCDILLVSHGHFDHLGGEIGHLDESDAVTIARATGPTWPCIHEMQLWLSRVLNEGAAEVIGMNRGGTVDARGIGVSMVAAFHSAGDVENDASLYLGEPVGFVFDLGDGRKAYYSGDTDVFGDMSLIRELHAPDVAFLPIGGHYTMGPRGAAMATGLLGVRTVVPLHYGTFPVLAGTPDELRAALQDRGLGNVQVLSPNPGETLDLP